jgi:hypothetical protein
MWKVAAKVIVPGCQRLERDHRCRYNDADSKMVAETRDRVETNVTGHSMEVTSQFQSDYRTGGIGAF